MATSDCSPVTFLKTLENAFYFKVETTEDIDLESDTFQAGRQNITNYWVRSKENKTLLLNKEHFEAQNLDSMQLSQSDCHFKIKTYTEHPEGGKGRAAMLYVTIRGENKVVCCRENREIYPKKMDISDKIDGNKSEALFYMTELGSSNSYKFESSQCEGHCLGFKSSGSDPNLIQLVLLPKLQEEVVDAYVLKLQSIQ